MKLIDDFYVLKSRERNYSIEGLRGIAVILVLNVHFFGQYWQQGYFANDNSVLHAIFRSLHAGHIGVDVFFVVSGFLIWKILFIDKREYGKYLLDRVNRLMPAYMLNLLVVSLPAFSLVEFIANAVFFPLIVPGNQYYNYVS